MTSPGGIYGKTVGDLARLTAPRSSPEAASPTAVSATRPDTPAPPGTRRRSHNDSCAHRLVFDDLNVNGGQWRDEDVLASGLSRVAVEPAPVVAVVAPGLGVPARHQSARVEARPGAAYCDTWGRRHGPLLDLARRAG